MSALTTSYCGGVGGPDDNAAQAGYLIVGALTRPGRLDDNEVGGGQLIVSRDPNAQPLSVHENQRGEVTTNEVAGTLKAGGGKPGQGYPCVVQPLAVRGRDGGSQIEIGAEGAPYNALRAGDGGSSRQSLIAVNREDDTVVRRLTPLECERLQGFPDDWTDGQSDAQRYRQMGNSLAVPVVEWIASRIVTVDAELNRE